jgi:protein-tyrosine phosphatase
MSNQIYVPPYLQKFAKKTDTSNLFEKYKSIMAHEISPGVFRVGNDKFTVESFKDKDKELGKNEIKNVEEFNGVEVYPGIYLGNLLDSKAYDIMRTKKIKHILSMTSGAIKPPSDFEYLHLSILDNSDEEIILHFDESFGFIHNALNNKDNIFVHCREGKSRSPTIVVGYIMKQLFMEKIRKIRIVNVEECHKTNIQNIIEDESLLEKAMNIVYKKYHIEPNLGFIESLKKFEKNLIEEYMNQDCF